MSTPAVSNSARLLHGRIDEHVTVPRKVLKEQYEGRLEPDEVEADQEFANDDDDDFDTYDAGNEFIRESAASPPAPNIEGAGKGDNLTKDSPNVNAKSPAHKSNGLDFGEFACLLGVVTAQIPRLVCKDK